MGTAVESASLNDETSVPVASELSSRESARAIIAVIDGAVRLAIAEASHMARWIYGSLFSLNMAGSAACVALEIAVQYKAWSASFMLLGIFFILLGGVSTARKLARAGNQMALAMRYWLIVAEENKRDLEAEKAFEDGITAVIENQSVESTFMWLSFAAFIAGIVGIVAGLATR